MPKTIFFLFFGGGFSFLEREEDRTLEPGVGWGEGVGTEGERECQAHSPAECGV